MIHAVSRFAQKKEGMLTMVCPKLHKGNCDITKDKCKKSYIIKMIIWGSCSILKRFKLKKKQSLAQKKVEIKKATTKKPIKKVAKKSKKK